MNNEIIFYKSYGTSLIYLPKNVDSENSCACIKIDRSFINLEDEKHPFAILLKSYYDSINQKEQLIKLEEEHNRIGKLIESLKTEISTGIKV